MRVMCGCQSLKVPAMQTGAAVGSKNSQWTVCDRCLHAADGRMLGFFLNSPAKDFRFHHPRHTQPNSFTSIFQVPSVTMSDLSFNS